MVALTDDAYAVRVTATPRSKWGTVRDSVGDPVLEVTREGFTGETWFTFSDPRGNPKYYIQTIAASTGPFKYTTRRYPIVDAATDDTVAALVRLWTGPFKRRFAVESAEGRRLATVATRSRLWAVLRAPPLGWLPPMWFVPPLTYDVRAQTGTRIATMQERTNVVGREFQIRMPYAGEFPWIAVFAAVVLGGRAGFAKRLP